MEIPRYWARTPQQVRLSHGTFTISLWGWSDRSVEDARVHSERRAARLRAGQLEETRWYPQYPAGVLREEVLRRFEAEGELHAAITRNRYGALVLNTRDVPFIDIDDELPGRAGKGCGMLGVAVLAFVGGAVVNLMSDGALAGLAFGLALFTIWGLTRRPRRPGPADHEPLSALRAFLERHPDLAYRLYRTAAGYRLALLGARRAPDSSSMQELMRAVGADPLYMRLCKNQRCYRARLTPKPWRVGLPAGQFTFPATRPPDSGWMRAYDAARREVSVASLIEERGRPGDPLTERLLAVHDEWVLGGSGRPLA